MGDGGVTGWLARQQRRGGTGHPERRGAGEGPEGRAGDEVGGEDQGRERGDPMDHGVRCVPPQPVRGRARRQDGLRAVQGQEGQGAGLGVRGGDSVEEKAGGRSPGEAERDVGRRGVLGDEGQDRGVHCGGPDGGLEDEDGPEEAGGHEVEVGVRRVDQVGALEGERGRREGGRGILRGPEAGGWRRAGAGTWKNGRGRTQEGEDPEGGPDDPWLHGGMRGLQGHPSRDDREGTQCQVPREDGGPPERRAEDEGRQGEGQRVPEQGPGGGGQEEGEVDGEPGGAGQGRGAGEGPGEGYEDGGWGVGGTPAAIRFSGEQRVQRDREEDAGGG